MGNCIRPKRTRVTDNNSDDDHRDFEIPGHAKGSAEFQNDEKASILRDAGSSTTKMKVKIRMSRKQVKELLERIERQGSVSMYEILDCNGKDARTAACSRPWRPKLETVPENETIMRCRS